MDSHDLLTMMEDAKEEYIWDAQQVRSGGVYPKTRRLPLRKILLVAAILILSLLLVGCTVAYVQGWFAEFFTTKGQQPLSDDQMALLEEYEQKIHTSHTQDGWTLELGSAISDGTQGYVLIRITAPEGVNLERVFEDNVVMSGLVLGNQVDWKQDFDLLTFPEGVVSDYGYLFQEDGDGLSNTEDLVIHISPDLEESTVYPFGKDAVYHVSIRNIFRESVNKEVWDGKSDILSFEEIYLRELLLEGTWEFSFDFGLRKGTETQQELMTHPFSTAALHWMQYGEDTYEDSAWFIQEHTVTSFVLKPLTAILTYEPLDEGRTDFAWYPSPVHAVLKDGREIKLSNGYGGEENQFLMQSSAPMVLEEIDHIRMVDGTKLYPDGRVELPEWKGEPLPPAPEALIPGETKIEEIAAYYAEKPAKFGVYVYYTDFDEDGVPDIAVWQDGSYIALCLMGEDGTLKEKLPIETGSDVQTRLDISGMCTQYGGSNAEDLERYEILQPIKEFWQYSVQ